MLASKLYAPTLRETPADAEVISHQLLLRAGFIRKINNGIYTYLPLAWKVIKKIQEIIREEMDAKGGQELAMPIIQPAQLWQETGRWDVYGKEMFRLKDRHDRDFCLGPTHEELISTLVKMDVSSYKQLPLLFYQIQNKYRDEIRPRFGLMRSREFIMKDLYSFDKDEKGMNESYQKMYDAYTNIFNRCGLKFRAVEADSGAIGGSGSHEFMVIANSGEAEIAYCEFCDYAANVEKAELKPIKSKEEELLPLKTVHTPYMKTIADVCNYLNITPDKTIKTVAYVTNDDKLVLALVRGDHEVNEIKIINKINCIDLRIAEEKDIKKYIETSLGFIGPVEIKPNDNVIIIADKTVMNMYNAVCGSNIDDHHHQYVTPQRDFSTSFVEDIRLMKEGDPCPRCNNKVKTARGIEVGQVFKLYTKYSEALSVKFIAENGKEQPMSMGCYGIGVGRTMAASIEQNYDENGIIWPLAIAPYHAVIVPVNAKDEVQMTIAKKLYTDLNNLKIETVLDDRNERPGVKFKDADLIGYPLKIIVGPKTLDEGTVEIKTRKDGNIHIVSTESFLEKVQEIFKNLD